jgi:hypothetical protein
LLQYVSIIVAEGFMLISRLTLMVMAAIVWYAGGIALLFKGGSLVKGAFALDSQSVWIYMAPVLGVLIGLLKARFIFNHACKKNINRIRALVNPRIWQFFRPGMLLFLAIIIPAGAWMSRAAAGNFGYLCGVAALDLSIATALLTSSLAFWKMNAFSNTEI